jgi:hypothetical protein
MVAAKTISHQRLLTKTGRAFFRDFNAWTALFVKDAGSSARRRRWLILLRARTRWLITRIEIRIHALT